MQPELGHLGSERGDLDHLMSHGRCVELAGLPVLGLSSRLYEAETSRTFSALRDAVPENPLPALAPISDLEAAQPVDPATRLPAS